VSRVFIDRFDAESLRPTVIQAMKWIGWRDIVAPDARVFLKPNFTYPFYKPGVTTSPAFIEAVVATLAERTSHITIGESDGGAHSWTADEAFEGHHLAKIRDEFGARLVNLSRLPRERCTATVAGRAVTVELPAELLHETDVFITLPVPKVHVMTGVSLGFKNQWGCLPDVKRLRYHHAFSHTVVAVNKLLKPKIALFDGTFFLNRSGPMAGDPVEMNLIVAADDIGAGSLACCEIMGIDPGPIRHLQMARREGLFPESLAESALNKPIGEFIGRRFTLERTLLNWATLGAFNSRLVTQLLYDSPLARPAHQLLYLVRGTPKDLTPQW
jgi:uncharacterized protein (DUF362 family)